LHGETAAADACQQAASVLKRKRRGRVSGTAGYLNGVAFDLSEPEISF
jgi:hypothetical protein